MVKEVYPNRREIGGTTAYSSCELEVNKLLADGWRVIHVANFPNNWTHELKSYVLEKDATPNSRSTKDE